MLVIISPLTRVLWGKVLIFKNVHKLLLKTHRCMYFEMWNAFSYRWSINRWFSSEFARGYCRTEALGIQMCLLTEGNLTFMFPANGIKKQFWLPRWKCPTFLSDILKGYRNVTPTTPSVWVGKSLTWFIRFQISPKWEAIRGDLGWVKAAAWSQQRNCIMGTPPIGVWVRSKANTTHTRDFFL